MPRKQSGDQMGRFFVEFDVSNYRDVVAADLGNIDAGAIRRARIRGYVDTGADHFILPAAVVKQLGLRKSGKVKVRYADGRTGTRDLADDAHVELLGRHGTFTATVESNRAEALIGAIILETFDLLVDCRRQCLVPRDPHYIISEVG